MNQFSKQKRFLMYGNGLSLPELHIVVCGQCGERFTDPINWLGSWFVVTGAVQLTSPDVFHICVDPVDSPCILIGIFEVSTIEEMAKSVGLTS